MISASGATAWQLRSEPEETGADPETLFQMFAEGEAEIKALKESFSLFLVPCCYYGMAGQESEESTRLLRH